MGFSFQYNHCGIIMDKALGELNWQVFLDVSEMK